MNIINTEIVNSGNDVYWQGLPARFGSLPQRRLLTVVGAGNDAAMVQRMLDACKMDSDEHVTVSLEAGEQVAWHALRTAVQPSVVFLVGVAPSQLGVSALFKLHELNSFDDMIWLPAMPTAHLAQHDAERKQLWSQAMKPLLLDRAYPRYFPAR